MLPQGGGSNPTVLVVSAKECGRPGIARRGAAQGTSAFGSLPRAGQGPGALFADNPEVGIVEIETVGFNQEGTIVISFRRTFMAYRRGYGPDLRAVVPRPEPKR